MSATVTCFPEAIERCAVKRFALPWALFCLVAVSATVNGQSTTTVDLTTTLIDVNTDSGIGVHSTTTVPGGLVAVEYKVNNLGSPASSAGNIGLFISKESSFSPSATFIVYADLFDAVPATGSTQPVNSNITVPVATNPGTYYIIVVANYDHMVPETNYNNNPSNALAITVKNP
jgi:hypothetical protein